MKDRLVLSATSGASIDAGMYVHAQVLGIDGRHRECLLRYARLLLQAGQHDAALKLAQEAASSYANDYDAAKLHADALRCAGRCRACNSARTLRLACCIALGCHCRWHTPGAAHDGVCCAERPGG